MTPGSAIRHTSVARHVADCATRPSTGWDVHMGQDIQTRVILYAPTENGRDMKNHRLVGKAAHGLNLFNIIFQLYEEGQISVLTPTLI